MDRTLYSVLMMLCKKVKPPVKIKPKRVAKNFKEEFVGWVASSNLAITKILREYAIFSGKYCQILRCCEIVKRHFRFNPQTV